MTRLPDEEIKGLINTYKNGKDELLDLIIKKLSLYIYNYPLAVFKASRDIASGYYTYVLESLPKILQSYTPTETLFETWFTVVLRNRYYNYLRRYETRDREYPVEQEYVENIPDNNTATDNSRVAGMIASMLDSMKPKDRLLIRLLYFPLQPKDIDELIEVSGRTREATMLLIREKSENTITRNMQRAELQHNLAYARGRLSELRREQAEISEQLKNIETALLNKKILGLHKKADHISKQIQKRQTQIMQLQKKLESRQMNYSLTDIGILLNTKQSWPSYRLNHLRGILAENFGQQGVELL